MPTQLDTTLACDRRYERTVSWTARQVQMATRSLSSNWRDGCVDLLISNSFVAETVATYFSSSPLGGASIVKCFTASTLTVAAFVSRLTETITLHTRGYAQAFLCSMELSAQFESKSPFIAVSCVASRFVCRRSSWPGSSLMARSPALAPGRRPKFRLQSSFLGHTSGTSVPCAQKVVNNNAAPTVRSPKDYHSPHGNGSIKDCCGEASRDYGSLCNKLWLVLV